MGEETPLGILIREEIEQRGPIPFRRFMELALYHPELGYYPTGKNRVGKEGDFLTSVSTGSLFGRLLAHSFIDTWEQIGRPEPFDLVEIGANHGQLFGDVAQAIAQIAPDLFAIARFRIVEPFPKLREIQQEHLRGNKVEWSINLQELADESVTGVIWSNELFDSLPVHRLQKFPHGWAEAYVSHGEEGFGWTVGTTTYDPADAPAGFPAWSDLADGFTTELWPHADFWQGELARVLARGRVVTIDYGFPATELYASHRKSGTLQAYHRHKRTNNLLARAGEQDITAHVNFTALIESGKKAGLGEMCFMTQERFLMNVLKTMPPADLERWSASEKKQFNTLVHPDMLGHVFKVLIQEKTC
jgi:SAM-dependent MidA family methyltransferase